MGQHLIDTVPAVDYNKCDELKHESSELGTINTTKAYIYIVGYYGVQCIDCLAFLHLHIDFTCKLLTTHKNELNSSGSL